jgi:hypothetical protein
MMDVLDKLNQIGALQLGEMPPDWVTEHKSWGTAISHLCREAAKEIESLRTELENAQWTDQAYS